MLCIFYLNLIYKSNNACFVPASHFPPELLLSKSFKGEIMASTTYLEKQLLSITNQQKEVCKIMRLCQYR